MKYKPKHVLEYALLRLIATVVSLLPYRIALAMAWLLAGIAFHGFGFRRAETLRRMRGVFGDRFAPRQYRRMAWISGRNMAFNVVEILRGSRATGAWCEKVYDHQETVAIMKRQMAIGQGGILAAPHMGNWDLAGIAYSTQGIPTFSIAARQRNPLVNDYFDRVRTTTPGIQTLSRGDSGILKTIVRNLRRGGILAILPDVRMNTPGIQMPLLGGTANLGTGMATFARMTGVPIFPIIITRVGWARHRIRALPAVHPNMDLDKDTDVHRMTAVVLAAFDREIQADPEQWFWFNKRWVLDPVTESERNSNDSDQ